MVMWNSRAPQVLHIRIPHNFSHLKLLVSNLLLILKLTDPLHKFSMEQTPLMIWIKTSFVYYHSHFTADKMKSLKKVVAKYHKIESLLELMNSIHYIAFAFAPFCHKDNYYI